MAKIEHAIEVNVPLSKVYQQLVQFEEFPRFMKGVHSVHQLDDAHLHWHAERGGREMEWDSEITQNIPEQCIAWRNTSGPRSEGKLTLETIDPGRTRIALSIDSDDTAQHPTFAQADPTSHAEDLARFKKMMEGLHGGHGPEANALLHDAGALDALRSGPASISAHGTSTAAHTRDSHHRFPAGVDDNPPPENMSQATIGMRNASRHPGQAWLHADWQSDDSPAWQAPFALMRTVARQMDRTFSRLGGAVTHASRPTAEGGGHRQSWTPPVDIARFQDEIVIFADLPGVKKDEVEIRIVGNQLSLEGERRNEHALHYDTTRRSERKHGHFYRSLALPEEINPDLVKARLHDGVLEIRFPRMHVKSEAHRVEIKQGFD